MPHESRIRYAAGTLAAAAFLAVTQILSVRPLDLALYVALALFAVNIPFQIILFFMERPFSSAEEAMQFRARPQDLSRWKLQYSGIYLALAYLSMPATTLGFVALFWHFAWWLGVLFAL